MDLARRTAEGDQRVEPGGRRPGKRRRPLDAEAAAEARPDVAIPRAAMVVLAGVTGVDVAVVVVAILAAHIRHRGHAAARGRALRRGPAQRALVERELAAVIEHDG